jgi:hypothetical protein
MREHKGKTKMVYKESELTSGSTLQPVRGPVIGIDMD